MTYLVAARRLSGNIKDSEATQLWEESRSIRTWSTERAKELTDDLDDLKQRVTELEVKNGELASLNRQLTEEKFHLQNLLDQEKRFNEQLRWDAENSPRRRRSDNHFSNGGEDHGGT